MYVILSSTILYSFRNSVAYQYKQQLNHQRLLATKIKFSDCCFHNGKIHFSKGKFIKLLVLGTTSGLVVPNN